MWTFLHPGQNFHFKHLLVSNKGVKAYHMQFINEVDA